MFPDRILHPANEVGRTVPQGSGQARSPTPVRFSGDGTISVDDWLCVVDTWLSQYESRHWVRQASPLLTGQAMQVFTTAYHAANGRGYCPYLA